MKIIQINVVADRGSTGKIAGCIDSELKKSGHESLVCYGRKTTSVAGRFHFGSEAEAALSKIANRCGNLMYASSPFATAKLIKKIKREKPDVVHLHCINGFCVNIYKLLKFLAKERIATAVTHHAEFYFTGNCGYAFDCRQFTDPDGCRRCPISKEATGILTYDGSALAWRHMHDAFQAFNKEKLRFTAVSPWVKKRSLTSPIVRGFGCDVVLNGVDTSTFRIKPKNSELLKRIPDIKEKLVLHVTADFSESLTSVKGGKEIIRLAKMMPEITFIVACSHCDIKSPLPDNIYVWGHTKDQNELADLYNAADATVIASSRETFSMVVAESLCCGTPVAGYLAGGPESIAIPEYSTFVEYGNIDALKEALRKTLDAAYYKEKISGAATEKYSEKAMTKKYMDIYQQIADV